MSKTGQLKGFVIMFLIVGGFAFLGAFIVEEYFSNNNNIPNDTPIIPTPPPVGPVIGIFIQPIIPNPDMDGSITIKWTGVGIGVFILYRSVNNSDFINIEEQKGSDYIRQDGGYFRYEYIDEVLQSGIYTYKIEGTQIDKYRAIIEDFVSNTQSVIVNIE